MVENSHNISIINAALGDNLQQNKNVASKKTISYEAALKEIGEYFNKFTLKKYISLITAISPKKKDLVKFK